jgi:hypothetical protein
MLRTLFPWSNPGKLQHNMLEHVLKDLLSTSPRKEAILRAVISAIELPDIQSEKESTINSIITEVTEKCAPILRLPQRDYTSAFQEDLGKFLKDTLHVWEDSQRSESRIVATSIIEEAVGAWGEQEHQAEATTNTPQDSIPQEPVAILFPQVYQVTTENPSVINHGSALWSDRGIYQRGKSQYHSQYTRNLEALGGTTRVRHKFSKFK